MTPPRLAQRPTAAGAKILGLGSTQPERVVTNDDLAAGGLDTTDEWIRARVGIVERRFAGPDESLVDMAVDAGAKHAHCVLDVRRLAGHAARRPLHVHALPRVLGQAAQEPPPRPVRVPPHAATRRPRSPQLPGGGGRRGQR